MAALVNKSSFHCHVALRPQLYNEVRSNETLIACESCSRILYYVEPPPEAPQPDQPGVQAEQNQSATSH